jgi:hypothetical protein
MDMSFYATAKAGRNRTNILVAATGEHVCQLLNKEVATWLLKAERARADDVAFQAERRVRRTARVRAYLDGRAARPAQLKLFA